MAKVIKEPGPPPEDILARPYQGLIPEGEAPKKKPKKSAKPK